MGSDVYDSPWTFSSPTTTSDNLHSSLEIKPSKKNQFLYGATTPKSIPYPPPLPKSVFWTRRSWHCCNTLIKQTRDHVWDHLFMGTYGADVYLIAQDNQTVPAHFCVLSIASPVLREYLMDSKPKNGIRYLNIPGMPLGAVSTFARFLYSSCYDEDDMKKFALHLLVLSHSFAVPLLKKVCTQYLEECWLNTENVIDILQLARKCDAPRLTFMCTRLVVRQFKAVASTEGWKVMRRVDPALEQELLESVVESDSRKQEKQRKIEEKRVYLQLHEANEALVHIWKDGCSTIGPRDKLLKGSQVTCTFPACKGIEMLVRHFFSCKTRVPGGCGQCKRMWKLLELHSCMCDMPDSCNVPLCRHFKEKMRQRSKNDETKWKLLVRKVMEAKRSQDPFAARLS
ncbi:unnamed protein product [Amaranthus hypochondriacus]